LKHLNVGFPSKLIADEVSPEVAGMATGSDTPTSIIILSDFDSSLTASDSCVHSSETIGKLEFKHETLSTVVPPMFEPDDEPKYGKIKLE
jgi:hypothetical protein